MPLFGDEVGLLWNEPPVIKEAGGRGKCVEFDANAKQKPDYTPPTRYRSFLGLPRIGFDIEGLDPKLKTHGPGAHRGHLDENGVWVPEGKVVGFAIAYGPGDSVYYPTEHANTGRCVRNPEAFYAQLRADAAEYEGEVVGANLQYDLDWMATRHGVVFKKAKFLDIQIAEPLLNENRLTYKLGPLAKDYLGEGKRDDKLLELYGKDYISNMDRVDPGWAAEYGEGDTLLPLEIIDRQQAALEKQGLTDLFDLESRLTPLLLQMRGHGVRVDLDACERAYNMTKEKAREASERMRDKVGFTVDIWSNESIARAFDKAGVAYPKTATGRPSFRKDWLNACPADIGKMIVEQRTFEKIGGTFLKNYILEGAIERSPGDYRIHAMFNQCKSDDSGTVSGRFSSSNPNLQNIPARHPILGPLCRSIFIPEEDMDWGSADWSQIEYRFLVHYAAITPGIDADLAVRMYRERDADFHKIAAELTGLDRKIAKNINFGVVYGMGVATMAANLGRSMEEAEEILNEFHGRFPFLKAIYNTASNQATKNRRIKTILGRRRRFDMWELGGKLFPSREAALSAQRETRGKLRGYPRVAQTHKALNALLQGSAADLMKLAMVRMYEDGIFDVLVPHLTVHDEMNVSIPRTKEGKEAFEEMVHTMENSMKLKVPVIASAAIGSNWDEAK